MKSKKCRMALLCYRRFRHLPGVLRNNGLLLPTRRRSRSV